MKGFLAYIVPVEGAPVDPGFGVPGWPAHPIAPGGPPGAPTHPIYWPPGIWGGAPLPGYPAHPIAPGGPPPWVSHPIPPGVWPTPPGGSPPGFWGGSPAWPAHPIAPGGPPPGIWGGPGSLPPWAMPPIFIPIPPGEKPPEGGSGLTPSHPIVIPPSQPGGDKMLVGVYVPGVGGVWFLIETPPPAPTHPIATPTPPAGPKR